MAGRGTDIVLGKCRIYGEKNDFHTVYASVKKPISKKSWKVNESLFPCELSEGNINLAEKAVELAVKIWGHRSLTKLEAEELQLLMRTFIVELSGQIFSYLLLRRENNIKHKNYNRAL